MHSGLGRVDHSRCMQTTTASAVSISDLGPGRSISNGHAAREGCCINLKRFEMF